MQFLTLLFLPLILPQLLNIFFFLLIINFTRTKSIGNGEHRCFILAFNRATLLRNEDYNLPHLRGVNTLSYSVSLYVATREVSQTVDDCGN